MLKELQDIINEKTLSEGVYFSEDEPIFGRGSEIIEQAKHAIVYAIAFNPKGCWEDKMGNITMFSDLITEIENGNHEDDYLRINYHPMGAWVVSDAMGDD